MEEDLSADYFGHALEYISDVDRKWFEEHPGATYYHRKPIQGEFDEPDDIALGGRVKVTRLSENIRMRDLSQAFVILHRRLTPEEDERLAKRMKGE